MNIQDKLAAVQALNVRKADVEQARFKIESYTVTNDPTKVTIQHPKYENLELKVPGTVINELITVLTKHYDGELQQILTEAETLIK